MSVKDSYIGVPLPIYAPTNMTIQGSVHYHDPLHNPSDMNYQGEWGLTFEASCNTLVSFAHVRSVVQKISDVTASAPDGGSGTSLVTHPVDFAAGEIIGYYIHDVGYLAWDFVVTDASVTNAFGNQARYVDGQLKYLHAICPFDPYPPTQRQTYLSLLGTTVDPPVAGRSCGTVAHDRLGTVAGAWFHSPYAGEGAQQARDASRNPLSVFKAETGAVYVADLDGTGSSVGFLTFRIDATNTTYRDPETITSTYCYERQSGMTGWAYLNLVSNTQLQVVYSATGACPASFPNANVETYYR
ncbi:MAG: hypothetical protein M3O36_05605 [Myxococcota bacterium]|nr:hypothetical protein [Myxococcota bacterium]